MMRPYTVGPWSLEDLFPSDEAWEAALQDLETQVAAFAAHREELGPDLAAETFRAYLEELEAIHLLAARIGAYAHLRFSENNQDPRAQAMLGKMRQVMAQMQNRLLFFELWWRQLDDATAQRLLQAAGPRYRYYLEKQRLYRPYTLSEAEEKIINLKDVSGIRALLSTYSTLTNRYIFRLEVDGEVKELTRGELMTYARSPRADLRERAYRVLYEVFLNDKSLIAPIYQAVTQDWYNEQVLLRGFSKPISARNLANHLPDEVIDTLLEVTRRNASLFQRFFRLKARVLGMERLRRYDIYAPVSQTQRTYDFDTAAHLVLEAFSAFDPIFADLAQQVLDRQHVHSEVKPGKSGGAFCMTPYPGATPWVLLNYQGRLEDVATMAHELGHAIHGLLAGQHSVFTFHAPLPLAETASTFAEMLLVDALLEREEDPAVRRDILFKQLDDNYATIMRQAYFALFEIQAHERFPQGAAAEDIAQIYRDLLAEQFGDAVEVSDEFAWEWLMIPHFYRVPFYVYAYAFGQLLVLALYQRYRAEGETFKPVYFRLLKAGGSRAPMEILHEAGINPGDPAFWQQGFDILADWVMTLETTLPA